MILLAVDLEAGSEHLDALIDFDSILSEVRHGLTLTFFYLRSRMAKTLKQGLKFLLCAFKTVLLGLL